MACANVLWQKEAWVSENMLIYLKQNNKNDIITMHDEFGPDYLRPFREGDMWGWRDDNRGVKCVSCYMVNTL